jgi:hypothetical protein
VKEADAKWLCDSLDTDSLKAISITKVVESTFQPKSSLFIFLLPLAANTLTPGFTYVFTLSAGYAAIGEYSSTLTIVVN